MNFISFLSGPSGKLSTMRLSTLLAVILILSPRIIIALKTGTYPALSWEEVSIVLGALGIKAYQRGKEEK